MTGKGLTIYAYAGCEIIASIKFHKHAEVRNKVKNEVHAERSNGGLATRKLMLEVPRVR